MNHRGIRTVNAIKAVLHNPLKLALAGWFDSSARWFPVLSVYYLTHACDFRCPYCSDGAGVPYHRLSRDTLSGPDTLSLLREIRRHCDYLVITGGEPLLQNQTPELVFQLLSKGYRVLMETNGSFSTRAVDPRCINIIDVKCPGSGESHRFEESNLLHMDAKDQVKFVLCHREDYEYAKSRIRHVPQHVSPENILFSPVTESLAPAELATWILEDGLNVRLQLQLHRTLWPDVDRGV